LVILGSLEISRRSKVTNTLYANVSFEKPIFTFIKHFASMIPLYYSQSSEFNYP